MADFCSLCAPRLGFKEEDINIEEIYKDLKPNHYQNVLCEGCALGGIAKKEENEKEEMLLANVRDGKWVTLEEYKEYIKTLEY